jgi:protein involved in polysaccharide export with SLBB domain
LCPGFGALAMVPFLVVTACATFVHTTNSAGVSLPTGKAQDQTEEKQIIPDYVLQRGDELEVRVFNMPELTTTVRVRPDGRISLLLLGDLQASGLTATQLADNIGKGYAQEFRNPRVAVIVRNFPNLSVYVGGEVGKPGVLPLHGDLTVTAALIQAGGVRNTGKLKQVVLLRKSASGTPELMSLNIADVLKKKAADIALQPFDVVFVPTTTVARMDQFMDQYVRQLLPISVGAGFSYLFGSTIP